METDVDVTLGDARATPTRATPRDDGRSPTDAEMIAEARRSPEQFTAVFDRHYERIYAYAARRLGRDLADDVASETFLVAFSLIEGYDANRPDAAPWLYGIASNLIARQGCAESKRFKILAKLAPDGAVRFGDRMVFPAISYDELAGLTTPEAIDKYLARGKTSGWNEPGPMILHEVLPPDVEAAVFRWYARKPGVEVDRSAVNFDGRPAIAVTLKPEDWLRDDYLFDPDTYQLIGLRSVAVKNNVSEDLDGIRRVRKGDVLHLEIRESAGIVDKVGDTVTGR